MLDLDTGYGRHVGIYIGAHRYAEENGWQVTIDEFVEHQLSTDGKGPSPYDGIIARVTRGLYQRAQKAGVPVVNV